MRNYIAVVFNENSQAYEGLHALWQLDSATDITVHGTAVVHRNRFGGVQVDTKETHPVLATAVGVGIGVLLGLFAGPIGIAVGTAAGVGLGAAAGGLIGGLADMGRADTRNNALIDTAFVLGKGQSAVIADVTEDWAVPVDSRMLELGGAVYRRAKSDVRNDNLSFNDEYFYPYEYIPPVNSLYL